jgi:hypothetical protein
MINSLKAYYGQPFYFENISQSDSSKEDKNNKALSQLLFIDAGEILSEQRDKKKLNNFSNEFGFSNCVYTSPFLFNGFKKYVDISHKKGARFLRLFLLFCSLKIDLTYT